MNGEMYQICCIAAATKKALKEKSVLSFTPLKYENRIEFQFLPEKKLFSTKKYKAENVSAWYDYCLKKGMYDLKFLMVSIIYTLLLIAPLIFGILKK